MLYHEQRDLNHISMELKTMCNDSKRLRINKFTIKHVRSIIAICKIQHAANNPALNTCKVLSEISKVAKVIVLFLRKSDRIFRKHE